MITKSLAAKCHCCGNPFSGTRRRDRVFGHVCFPCMEGRRAAVREQEFSRKQAVKEGGAR